MTSGITRYFSNFIHIEKGMNMIEAEVFFSMIFLLQVKYAK